MRLPTVPNAGIGTGATQHVAWTDAFHVKNGVDVAPADQGGAGRGDYVRRGTHEHPGLEILQAAAD